MLSYVELFAPLRGSSTSSVVTQGLHHNAACVCDDGQKGAASSPTRTLQCVSSLQSLFRCIQKEKKRSDGQTGAASSLNAI